ncbi:MAG: ATP-binding protein, partial [Pyrinomonadaceae bacterium]
LDSSLKCDAAGFARYYQERNRRLDELQDGYVRVHLHIEPGEQGGRLVIEVQDSGKGFDVGQTLMCPVTMQGLSGRGLELVRQLSRSADWADGGRLARVEFAWGLWHNRNLIKE